MYTVPVFKMRPAYLCPLFQIAPVENDDSYDELKRDAKTCLSLMSQGLLYTEQIPLVLIALQEVSHQAAVAVFPPASHMTGLFTDPPPPLFLSYLLLISKKMKGSKGIDEIFDSVLLYFHS